MNLSKTRASTPGIAATLVLMWVQLYTAGLSGAHRERRAGQIHSDLWEHYADRTKEGAHPALIGLEAISRAARGAAADLFWRFQLEGSPVQINLPIERIGGACLLLLVAAGWLSLNVSGYNTDPNGFDGELQRLARVSSWQVSAFTALQVLSGIGMLVGAVILHLTLRSYASASAALVAIALAAAGVLVLVNAPLYATAAALADEFVATAPENRIAVLSVARAFMLTMSTSVQVMAVLLALSVYAFALVGARHRLVPAWLNFVAGGSGVAMASAIVSGLAGQGDVSWVSFISFLGLLFLWLMIAGAWLLLGGSTAATDNAQPLAANAVTPAFAPEPDLQRASTVNRWLLGAIVTLLFASIVSTGFIGILGFLIVVVPAAMALLGLAYAWGHHIDLPGAQS